MVRPGVTSFFFGSRARMLFGVYHPPTTGGPPRAVVLCAPWGPEAIAAHRALRHLALLLTAAGLHVLRFDYFGTGDAGGDGAEGDIGGWTADVLTAVQELADMSGTHRVALVGLRHGALLAAAAARRARTIDRLVLWDPIDGRTDYLGVLRDVAHALDAPAMLPVARSAALGGGFEAFGFVLTKALLQDMRALDLRDAVADLDVPVTVLVSGSTAELAVAAGSFPSDRPPATLHVPGPPCWVEDGAASLPLAALSAIVQAL